MPLITLLLIAILMITVGCGSGSEDDIRTGEPGSNILSERNNQIQVVPQMIKPEPEITEHAPTVTPTYHPLITNQTPPPLNLPRLEPTPGPTIPYEPVLPIDEEPISVPAVNDQRLTGSVNGNGNISITENLINAITDEGDSIKIAYRLPGHLNEISDRTFSGSILVEDISTLASTHKRLSVNDESGLLLYEAFYSSQEPLVLDPTLVMNLTQNPNDQSTDSDSWMVPLDVTTETGKIQLNNGETVTIESAGGTFQVFLKGSYKISSSVNSTDPFTGYQIHVWILRTN